MGDFPLKFADSGIKYRGYTIHKKIYQSYLLFYIISDENQTVYVLRILKDIMNWRNICDKKYIYHFQIIDDKVSGRNQASKSSKDLEVFFCPFSEENNFRNKQSVIQCP